MKKLFLLLLTVLSVTLCASAQTRTVTGTVVDAETDEPIIGAAVTDQAGKGVNTDIDGNFSIVLPESVTKLTVSSVGYNPMEVKIKGGKMEIRLTPSATALDEVIAVAYGTAKKSAFTGSATVIKSTEIEQAQVSNALDALTGKVAGVQLNNASGQPGQSDPSIFIRGISSLNAGNVPLIVVDGVPYSGDMNNISTQDIESMTILKDAASNALYGARGANGVIMITTKKGGNNGEAQVSVDAKWGANMRATQDYKLVKDPAAYYEMYYKSLYNYSHLRGFDDGNDGFIKYDAAQAHIWANQNLINGAGMGLGYNVYTIPEGQYMIGTNGKLNPNATLGRMATFQGQQYWLTPDNWLDEAYHTSLRQEYNVSVANGNDRGNFYASASYLKNEGITNSSDYERFTGRLAAETQAKDWLKVGANMSYTHFQSRALDEDGSSASSGNVFAAATQVAPIYPLYIRDANGNILVDSNGFQRYDYGDKDNAGLERPVYGQSNALSQAILDRVSSEGNAFNATGYFEVRFLKDFKFTSNNNVNVDETRSTQFTNPWYGQYATANGMLAKGHGRSIDYTFQQLLNWSHQFGAHNVSILAGHENYWARSYSLSGQKENMFDPFNDELATAVIVGSTNSSSSAYNTEGWIFRGQYDYSDKYFGSVSFRRDGSSRFHPDHRWGNFWSAGGAWILTKEDWISFPQWVNMLKLKASYGEQGNDQIGSYRYTNTYTIVNSNGNPAAIPATMGNPNITWEKNANFNVGFEFDLFNARLGGSVEGFYRRTTDMLSAVYLPASFGFTGYYDNVGNMINGGIELDLHGTIIRTKDFSWDVNANFTWYKNEVEKLAEDHKGQEAEGYKGYANGNYFIGEGLPLHTFYMQKYAGVNPENGKAMYWRDITETDANGVTRVIGREKTEDYNAATMYLCGSALPHMYGGFGTNLTYRDFDLSVDFTYQIGGKVYDSAYASYMANPSTDGHGSNFHRDLYNAWTPENPNSNIPALVFNDLYATQFSDRFITNASYLTLQNINFGYTLPRSITRKIQVNKLRVYFSADNVFIWSKRQGLNPTQSITGSSSNAYYAPIRTLSGGINITF